MGVVMEKLSGRFKVNFARWVLFIGFLVLGFLVIMQIKKDAVKNAAKENANLQYRAELAAKGAISPAHHFLIANWLECNFYKQTKASCFASIRSAAAAYGDDFVKQVDAAARDLKLVGTEK